MGKQPGDSTLAQLERKSTDDERLAHLVTKDAWPVALCGHHVTDKLGTSAPGRDRCHACLRLAKDLGLGRPGWA